jgi:hypothetical protein
MAEPRPQAGPVLVVVAVTMRVVLVVMTGRVMLVVIRLESAVVGRQGRLGAPG